MLEFFSVAMSSDVSKGIVVAAVITSLLYSINGLPSRIYKFMLFHFTTVVTINNDSRSSYLNALSWSEKLDYMKHIRRINISETISRTNLPNSSAISFGVGRHIIKYDGEYVLLIKTRGETRGIGEGTITPEALSFRTFGRSRKTIISILKSIEEYKGSTPRTMAWNGYRWEEMALNTVKLKSSVFLNGTLMDDIISDISRFRKSSEWYRDRSIPFRRGYLFDGAPGTGKTSTIAAIANELNMNMYLLNLSTIDTDARMLETMSSVLKNSIVIIEDMDTTFLNDKPMAKGLTTGGILNALDGILSPTEIIIIATTNDKSKLPAALIRPGRIDQIIQFGKINSEATGRAFKAFYPDSSRCEEFISYFIEDQNPASLMSILIKHPTEVEIFEYLKVNKKISEEL